MEEATHDTPTFLEDLDRPTVRRLLSGTFREPTDFDAFCLDHFDAVYRRFSTGMDRVQRENLLLNLVNPAEVVAKLYATHPDDVKRLLKVKKGLVVQKWRRVVGSTTALLAVLLVGILVARAIKGVLVDEWTMKGQVDNLPRDKPARVFVGDCPPAPVDSTSGQFAVRIHRNCDQDPLELTLRTEDYVDQREKVSREQSRGWVRLAFSATREVNTLTGRVVRQPEAAPVRGVTVKLESCPDAIGHVSTTDEHGSFLLPLPVSCRTKPFHLLAIDQARIIPWSSEDSAGIVLHLPARIGPSPPADTQPNGHYSEVLRRSGKGTQHEIARLRVASPARPDSPVAASTQAKEPDSAALPQPVTIWVTALVGDEIELLKDEQSLGHATAGLLGQGRRPGTAGTVFELRMTPGTYRLRCRRDGILVNKSILIAAGEGNRHEFCSF